MTMPTDVQSAGGRPPGTRASDYASSKYYFPPALPPDDDADPDAPAADPAAYAVAYPPPDVPLAAARRSRGRSHPVLGVALVLALLAGLAGGGYWFLNRNDDATASASPAARKVTAVTEVGTKPAGSVKTSGSYLFRPARRHFVVRFSHRPTTRTISVTSAGFAASALVMLDRDARALVEWTRIDSAVPVSEQDPFMRGMVTGLGRSAAFHVTSSRATTFHGRPARLVSLTARTGDAFTALVAIYQPTHALLILAPTGPTFDRIKNSFAWPV